MLGMQIINLIDTRPESRVGVPRITSDVYAWRRWWWWAVFEILGYERTGVTRL